MKIEDALNNVNKAVNVYMESLADNYDRVEALDNLRTELEIRMDNIQEEIDDEEDDDENAENEGDEESDEESDLEGDSL